MKKWEILTRLPSLLKVTSMSRAVGLHGISTVSYCLCVIITNVLLTASKLYSSETQVIYFRIILIKSY